MHLLEHVWKVEARDRYRYVLTNRRPRRVFDVRLEVPAGWVVLETEGATDVVQPNGIVKVLLRWTLAAGNGSLGTIRWKEGVRRRERTRHLAFPTPSSSSTV